MRLSAVAVMGSLLALAPAAAQTRAELPLERGFYVRTDGSCATANNANTALLTRRGLQWVTSRCVFGRITRIGPDRWQVVQTCEGPGRATATWHIPDRTSFSFTDSNGWEHAARFCRQRDMPQPWRSTDISALIN